MPETEIRIEGVGEINRRLKALPVAVERRVLSQAARAGGKIIAENAKSRVKSHRIRKFLKVFSVRTLKKGLVIAKIGIKLGRSDDPKEDPSYLALWIERGTAARFTKAGAYRGLQNKKPFLRPALDATRDDVIRVFRAKLLERLKHYEDRG